MIQPTLGPLYLQPHVYTVLLKYLCFVFTALNKWNENQSLLIWMEFIGQPWWSGINKSKLNKFMNGMINGMNELLGVCCVDEVVGYRPEAHLRSPTPFRNSSIPSIRGLCFISLMPQRRTNAIPSLLSLN